MTERKETTNSLGGKHEVVSNSIDYPQELHRVRISDKGYVKLKESPAEPISDRWGNGSKVVVVVDGEMVEILNLQQS